MLITLFNLIQNHITLQDLFNLGLALVVSFAFLDLVVSILSGQHLAELIEVRKSKEQETK